MNSLEFIEFYIKEYKRSVEWYKKYQEKNPISFVNTLKEEELILRHLQQIKVELEAWEVCKKHYHINKYEDINKGRDKKRFDITIWLNTENCDFKSCASYEECLKVKKALEVKDES